MSVTSSKFSSAILVIILLLLPIIQFLDCSLFVDEIFLLRWFLPCICIISIYNCITFDCRLCVYDLLILFVFMLWLIGWYVNKGSQKDIFLIGFAIILLNVYVVFKSSNCNGTIVLISIIVVCLFQTIISYLQWFEIVESRNRYFQLTGTYDNPAMLGAILALGDISLITMLDNKKYKILILLSILVVSILIILIDSRTTLLATIIPIAYFLVVRNKSKIKYKCNNIIAISIILLFIIGLIILLYFHRPASVIGRFFIWKVSLKMITEKLWLGHGIGSFFSSYMPAQANEFVLSSHRDWACYADNVTHPFNEFIAIACEIGIIGVVIVLLIFIVAWHFAKIQYKSLLLSIVIFAMFSYPTENHLWFIFVVAIFSICLLNDSKSIKLNKLILLSLYIGSVICVYPMSGKYIKPKYESLQYNKHFLSQYAKQLILKQTNDFATLEDIASKIPYIELYIDIGDLYLKSQKIDNAIKCYNLAKNMSPNRLVARYKLFSIYKDVNQLELANKEAYEIQGCKVKVDNTQTIVIKATINKYLSNLSKP